MRFSLVLLGLLAACSRPSVTQSVDSLLASGAWPRHQTLPSPARFREIYGEERDGTSVRERLRETKAGRSILDDGEAAVPELVALLADAERRTLATVFLAEIGGEAAATALLEEWRSQRGSARAVSLYRKRGGVSHALGQRYEGVDAGFYKELLHALSYAGRPRADEIAADTEAAMKTIARLAREGERTIFSGVRDDDITARWSHPDRQTAQEGLEILAFCGAPQADRLFRDALRLPDGELNWTVVQCFSFLGENVRACLPEMVKLIDDPRYGEQVRQELAGLVDER